MRIASLALTAIVLTAACGGTTASAPTVAPTPEPTAAVADSSLGKILVAATNKMTLYTYARDTVDAASTCVDACANTWPAFVITGTPVAAAGITGKLAVIARKDGGKQLAHNGRPLYFYNKDTKPGDTIGHNVGTVWSVVTNP